jgi:hypothetical protein
VEGVGTLKMLRKSTYILNFQKLLLLLSSALRGVGERSKRYRIINVRIVGVYFSS